MTGENNDRNIGDIAMTHRKGERIKVEIIDKKEVSPGSGLYIYTLDKRYDRGKHVEVTQRMLYRSIEEYNVLHPESVAND